MLLNRRFEQVYAQFRRCPDPLYVVISLFRIFYSPNINRAWLMFVPWKFQTPVASAGNTRPFMGTLNLSILATPKCAFVTDMTDISHTILKPCSRCPLRHPPVVAMLSPQHLTLQCAHLVMFQRLVQGTLWFLVYKYIGDSTMLHCRRYGLDLWCFLLPSAPTHQCITLGKQRDDSIPDRDFRYGQRQISIHLTSVKAYLEQKMWSAYYDPPVIHSRRPSVPPPAPGRAPSAPCSVFSPSTSVTFQ